MDFLWRTTLNRRSPMQARQGTYCKACRMKDRSQSDNMCAVCENVADLSLLGVVLVSWGTPAASRASLTCQGALNTGMVVWIRSSAAGPS